MKKQIKAINGNGLVKLLARRFKEENKDLYNLYDFKLAKNKYLTFMLGCYEPKKKNWEDFYIK